MPRPVLLAATVLAAAAFAGLATSAEARCVTRDLQGSWILQYRTPFCDEGGGDCAGQCRGKFDRRGRFRSEQCLVLGDADAGRPPIIELDLTVGGACRVDGTVVQVRRTGGGPFLARFSGWVVAEGSGLVLAVQDDVRAPRGTYAADMRADRIGQ